MLQKSPSGALSPYHYKGGYFHGIHYGSYFDDLGALKEIMDAEEAFILAFPERRRILIDIYETNITPSFPVDFVRHIERIKDRIVKLGICAEKKKLKTIEKALLDSNILKAGEMRFSPDMEENKTWLVGAGTERM